MTIPPTAPAVPAGWYPDPADPRGLRWWTGEAWSEHVAAAPNEQVAAPSGDVPDLRRFARDPALRDPALRSVPDALPARKDPYRDRNVIAMFALAVALLSIPGTLVSVVVGLPPFIDYLVGGAPIAIACFALLASFRLGHGVRMSLIALAFSVITMGAGFAVSAQPAVADLHDAPIQVPGLSELQDLSTELP